MKKLLTWACAITFALALNTQTATAAEKILVVGENFPPFEYVDASGKVVGVDVDIATAIFAKLGIEAEYKILPWTRAWGMIEKGEAEAVFTTSRKDKRKPFLYYPVEDMWNSEFVFFGQKGKMPSEEGYAGAKGKKVGVVRGNSYHDSFWSAFPHKDAEKKKVHASLRQATDLETSFKKLAAGRVDLVIADRTVGLSTLKSLGLLGKVVDQKSVLFGKGYPMPFAKKSSYAGIADLAVKFEAELKALKASGEYQSIMDKWLK